MKACLSGKGTGRSNDKRTVKLITLFFSPTHHTAREYMLAAASVVVPEHISLFFMGTLMVRLTEVI